MKAFRRVALALGAGILSLGTAQAQTIANLNLDTWVTRTTGVPAGVEAPANWLTDDDIFGPVSSSFGTLTKSTDRFEGNFAARLALDNSGDPSFFALGTAIPANFSLNNPEDLPGVPFTGRPTQLQFHYKFSNAAAAADSALVFMYLTRTTNGVTDLVGGLVAPLGDPTALTYRQASFPIQYDPNTTAAPDSVRLLIIYGTTFNTLTTGSALFLDNFIIGAATPTATRNRSQDAAVSVSPNPSADGRFALTSTEPALLASPYTVTDVTGRVVLQGAAASAATSRSIDLGTTATGIYSLQLRTPSGVITRKLVVR